MNHNNCILFPLVSNVKDHLERPHQHVFAAVHSTSTPAIASQNRPEGRSLPVLRIIFRYKSISYISGIKCFASEKVKIQICCSKAFCISKEEFYTQLLSLTNLKFVLNTHHVSSLSMMERSFVKLFVR